MPKLRALQSLRAIAALLVVLDHAAGLTSGHGFAREPINSWATFLGAQGVSVFFIISGFIMTYTADSAEDQTAPRLRAIRFAVRRIIRVVPLYWLLTAVVAVPMFLIGLYHPVGITVARLMKSFLFIPYLDAGGNMTPVLPIGWTLNYEMAFYALFAAILLLPHRVRTFVLLGVLVSVVIVGSFFYPISSGINPRSPLEFLTNPVILLFGLGAALGWLKLKFPHWLLSVQDVPLVAPLLAINLCVFVLAVHHPPVALRWSVLFWFVDFIVVALCAFGRPGTWPRLEALGDASYSLYLIHLLPVFLVYFLWQSLHFLFPVAFIITAIGLSIAAGLATYRWIERPLTRSLSRLAFPLRPTDRVMTELTEIPVSSHP
ncbi:MAG TPA: acyltransferase [Granulicella sp.]|jgi:peptidoglycan/LPS O-acetylase OafA/YrhL